MYQPFATSQQSSSVNLSNVDDSQWQQFLMEAKDLEAEFIADSVVAHVNAATTNFMVNCKSSIDASLDQQGLDHTGGMLVNAASALLASLGHSSAPTLAGESFGTEADRYNTTVNAGEAFDVKAKAREAYEWIKKMLAKVKAWVFKLFDGATSLAKAFAKLKEDAQKRIQGGKSAEKTAKFKLSKTQQQQLTTEGDAAKLASTGSALVTFVKEQQALVDFVFNDNFDGIKARVTAFEELTGYITADTIKGSKAEGSKKVDAGEDADAAGLAGAMRTELAKGGLFANVTTDSKHLGNSMTLGRKGTDLTTFTAATSPVVVLREANTQFENSLYSLSANAKAKELKFTDGKEFAVLGLDEIVTLCDTAVPALEAIARAKDSFNKGMTIEKTLDQAIKAIGNLGDDCNSVSPALLTMAGKLSTALSNPVGPFSATFVATLGAVYAVAKSSNAAYTK